jgi:hypothetical protein
VATDIFPSSTLGIYPDSYLHQHTCPLVRLSVYPVLSLEVEDQGHVFGLWLEDSIGLEVGFS